MADACTPLRRPKRRWLLLPERISRTSRNWPSQQTGDYEARLQQSVTLAAGQAQLTIRLQVQAALHQWKELGAAPPPPVTGGSDCCAVSSVRWQTSARPPKDRCRCAGKPLPDFMEQAFAESQEMVVSFVTEFTVNPGPLTSSSLRTAASGIEVQQGSAADHRPLLQQELLLPSSAGHGGA